MTYDIPHPTFDATSPRSHPYAPSLSSSASSSSSSVFSVVDSSSQVSASSASSAVSSVNCNWDGADQLWALNRPQFQNPKLQQAQQTVVSGSSWGLPPLRNADVNVPVPQELRQNPRRCSTSSNSRAPPQLVRQSERKINFVDSLVDSATQMVEVIWPLSMPACRNEGRVLPLRTFIQETLRRSRTSYSTLQVALYYLILIKGHVPKHDFTMEQPEDQHSLRALQCGRRMFLAALILASKYLQDRNYSARAWSKISGLKVCEINTNELAFLRAVDWKLHITDPIFERWQEVVLNYSPAAHPPSPGACPTSPASSDWKTIVPCLTPELDTIAINPRPTVRKVSLRTNIPETTFTNDFTSSPTTRLPSYLEPRTENIPPTPSLVRMGPLPTPILTPQSTVFGTPAVGTAAFGPRRPSMCTAIAQAQNACMARTALDPWNPIQKQNGLEAYHFCGRRPSLALSSTSLSSSPESMVSDNSSRSSRASSISSVSSAAWAPAASQPRLARVATCRNARLPCVAPVKEKEIIDLTNEPLTAEPMSSPDFSSFTLDDSDATPVPAALHSAEEAKTRKRGRSSTDLSLQSEVRALLNNPDWHPASNGVLTDRNVAETFTLTSQGRTSSTRFAAKALQSPSERCAGAENRKPVQRGPGRKRACCASETDVPVKMGPGMWEAIL
ncbi:hypothetical protein M501DRAFT_932853 [Patellaria atrata CBS 101060]|uniref:Cyclin n=1 Tax=Patellaria atrata CBS 101060 TaxID=1346257 RepID=A0A9P4SBT3_9PEZI|nr:hypothetical protein M501DRAFT_932853 [Patellaria atrata CBS 101060]